MNLVINAPNVHMGGGLTLLSSFLGEVGEDFQGCLVLDQRVQLPGGLPKNLIVHRIRPSIWGRLRSEWFLRELTRINDSVLCFGNLPPIFRLQGKVLLFLQNRYLIEPRTLRGFPFLHRLRITLERFWLRWGKRNVTHVIVQTPSMRRTVEQYLSIPAIVLPFSDDSKGYMRMLETPRDRSEEKLGFLYVASGEPHKNHRNLVEAWILLAMEDIRPQLCLTLDRSRFAGLCTWIEGKKRDFKLNIANEGSISPDDLKGFYRKAHALIYPSEFESLGLPLIEARCHGLPILAAERDYVRDVIDPEESFDPASPVSIARSVKRFLGIREEPLPVTDANEWLLKIYEIARR